MSPDRFELGQLSEIYQKSMLETTPRPRAVTSRARRTMRKRRRLPPGQRLILYCLLAGLVSLALVAPLARDGANFLQPAAVPTKPPFKVTEPLAGLAGEIMAEAAQPGLKPAVFMVLPETGRFVDVGGRQPMAAASMIKIPVFVAYLMAVERKDLSADQELTITPAQVAGGSGFLQWRPAGSKVKAGEAAELMITHSDNTATNMIIDALGGIDEVNHAIKRFGMAATRIKNPLPDFEGSNLTSPYDLVYLLARVDRGDFISDESRRLMYRTMERVRTRTLLPQGLPPGARISHKTGDIASMVGDAGIVTTQSGMRYAIAVQVGRPRNDRRANQLVRDISRLVYQSLSSGSEPAGENLPGHKMRRW